MPKATTITKIEHDIEALPSTDQAKLFDWLNKFLRKSHHMKKGRRGITEQINKVYANEPSELDRRVLNAQLASLEREEW